MALRDYLREEELTEEDQIAMARDTAYMDFSIEEADPQPGTAYMDFNIEETEPLPNTAYMNFDIEETDPRDPDTAYMDFGIEETDPRDPNTAYMNFDIEETDPRDPNTAYMDFGIEETEPLPQQGGDLASFIDQIAPAQQQQQGGDIQQMAIQSLMANAPPPQAQQMPQTTDIAPAQQYRDEVQKARATGKPLDILGGVLGAFAGGQAPRGPSFADIRGGARGMDLIRQIQEQRAQRQFETQQGKVQREQSALDLTAQQRQQGQGAQSAALLQVFPEMSPETAEALSLDPKAFAGMMRHGEQLRQEKQDAARRQDERAYQEAQWKERQAIQQADRIALKGAGRRGARGAGGGGEWARKAAEIHVGRRQSREGGEVTDEEISEQENYFRSIGRKQTRSVMATQGRKGMGEDVKVRGEQRTRAWDVAKTSRKDIQETQGVLARLRSARQKAGKLSATQMRDLMATKGGVEAIANLVGLTDGIQTQEAAAAFYGGFNPAVAREAGAAVSASEMGRQLARWSANSYSTPAAMLSAMDDIIRLGQGDLDRMVEFGGKGEEVRRLVGEKATYTITKPDGTTTSAELSPEQARKVNGREGWKAK